MRSGLVAIGGATLALGVILFGMGMFEQGQASAALASCYNSYPFYGYPTTCTDASNALYLWGTVMSFAALVGVVGFTFLTLGLFLPAQGMQPRPPFAPYFPPPAYVPPYPPPVYPPPQEPRTPPPGGP